MLIFNKFCNKSAMKNMLRFYSNQIYTSNFMQKPILYGDEVAPPVRFVMMTACILDIDIEFRKIDLFKNENHSSFYEKINSLKKVPAMVVGDTKICDSHAIALYLCKTAKKQDLYPDDPLIQANINEILFFNSSTLFKTDSEILSNYFAQRWPVDNKTIEEWYSALDYLEHHLNNNKWIIGNKMLLCDVCTVAVVTSILPVVPLKPRHQKIQEWIKRIECLPFYKINKRGLTLLYNQIESCRKS